MYINRDINLLLFLKLDQRTVNGKIICLYYYKKKII